MNAVVWYATGRQARTVKAVAASGETFRVQDGQVLPWVAAQPRGHRWHLRPAGDRPRSAPRARGPQPVPGAALHPPGPAPHRPVRGTPQRVLATSSTTSRRSSRLGREPSFDAFAKSGIAMWIFLAQRALGHVVRGRDTDQRAAVLRGGPAVPASGRAPAPAAPRAGRIVRRAHRQRYSRRTPHGQYCCSRIAPCVWSPFRNLGSGTACPVSRGERETGPRPYRNPFHDCRSGTLVQG